MAMTTQIKSRAEKHDVREETITPAKAKEYLLANVHNRNMSGRTVDRYTRDLLAGKWKWTGDPIRFNGEGTLIDGQHRLAAIIKANMPVDCVVIRGLPMDAQEAIDQGRMRQAADFLHMRGFAAAPRLAATARFLLWVKSQPNFKSTGRATIQEVLGLVERHELLPDSVQAVGNLGIGLDPSILAGVHYVGAHMLGERDLADEFVQVFVTGNPAYEGDPAQLWRERLLSQTRKAFQMRHITRRLGTIRAWNLFRKRQALQKFQIPDEVSFDDLSVDRI